MSHLDLFGYVMMIALALFAAFLLGLVGWVAFCIVRGWLSEDSK